LTRVEDINKALALTKTVYRISLDSAEMDASLEMWHVRRKCPWDVAGLDRGRLTVFPVERLVVRQLASCRWVREHQTVAAPHIDLAELLLRQRPRLARKGSARHARRRRRRSRQRPRRAKGDKSKNAKVAFIGVIYTLGPVKNGSREGPIHKRMYATFDSHAALFTWLAAEAKKRGYGTKRTLFLADGAEAIWDQQAIHFPKAEACIDWVHIVEKLWAAGRCLHAEGSAGLAAWVRKRVRDLRRRSGADKVITALSQAYPSIPKTGPGNKGKREKLLDTLEHLSKHCHRMRYHDLRADDLDIATGAVEGAVRNLVRMRLDGPGMRWSRGRSERVLHLRCILLNGQWDGFVAHLARRDQLQLAATPAPTRSHDAAKRAA